MRGFSCDLSLLQHPKSSTIADELKQHALERLEHYADLRPFYTDGSKGAEGVGCAFVSGRITRRFRLPDTTSVFTAELYAIYQVLKHIRRHHHSRCLIVTDSASSVMALRGHAESSSLILKILELVTKIHSGNGNIQFLWIPSHVNIQGNESADAAAKVASRSAHVRPRKVEADELKVILDRLVLDEWQNRWDSEPDCALRRIRPSVNRWESCSRRSRIEEVALTRLRIGHCHATHCHHFTNSEPPACSRCGARLTVKHVLSPDDICQELRAVKSRYFYNSSLGDVLGNTATVSVKQVLSYLHNIGFSIVFNRTALN